MRRDGNAMPGSRRHSHAADLDQRWIKDSHSTHFRLGPPYSKPGMPSVPRHKAAVRGVPQHCIWSIGDANLLGVPHGEEVGLDGKLQRELPLPVGGVAEGVLHHDAGLTVRAELESIHLQTVEDLAIAKPVAIRVVDQLNCSGELHLLPLVNFLKCGPETVDQLDRMNPEAPHLARYVTAEIGKVSILS